MIILDNKSVFPKNVTLILGFFDGVHLGHREVIRSAVNYAKINNTKTVLITFKDSPACYFNKKSVQYIYPRETSYEIIKDLGVDYIVENNFEEFIQIQAEDYLEKYLIAKFRPISISTGFNHSFGYQKKGTPKLLEDNQTKFGYKYFCIPPCIIDNHTVSSTLIKGFLNAGNIESANLFLGNKFNLNSTVIEGEKLGRKLGYPTANMKYPPKTVKIPYGSYSVLANNRKAVLNFGIKPTVNGQNELLEAHILDFKGNLYGKELKIEFLKRIRAEKKFNSLEELKEQIKKDIELC